MVVRDLRFFFYFVSILAFFTPSLAGAQGVNQNTADQVRRAYDKAFETMFKDPANLEKTFSFAGLAIKAGDFEGAIADQTKSIEILPNEVDSHLNRGIAEEALKLLDAAENDYYWILEQAGLPYPEAIEDPQDIDCLVIVKLPFFNESSGLKVSELIVLIFSLESILIISFNIAASPSLELFIILGI